ncbi:hypothetical protein AVEN_245948-1 [Araneus ventricosus]|uniref:Uncharacterized protein n=1 Tax=Araneus ventricosus TaxID=182803 RepID=A0A4Y2MEY3_ARAVE|nr:hypothetical protein AVEN_245948-1 [Araneus ventricosus]
MFSDLISWFHLIYKIHVLKVTQTKIKHRVPDSNFAAKLQQSRSTNLQDCNKFDTARVQDWNKLGIYSGIPSWNGRSHFFHTLTTGKVTSPNPTGDTRIDTLVATRQTCHKLAASNALQTRAKTEYEDT